MNARAGGRRLAAPLAFALTAALAAGPLAPRPAAAAEPALKVNDQGYFAARGLNVLVFSNWYDSAFSDAKISGVELIHHEVRTATNGDVRLSATPGQWDPIGKLVDRKVDAQRGTIEAFLSYPEHGFSYSIRAEARGDGVLLSVNLDKPLPAARPGARASTSSSCPRRTSGRPISPTAGPARSPSTRRARWRPPAPVRPSRSRSPGVRASCSRPRTRPAA
jgi:hypothetical protein